MHEIIQGLWIGDDLTVMERLCIESFIQNGHAFHLYTYRDMKNIPDKTVVIDANTIVPEEVQFKDSRGGFAAFSDYFRYKLLYEKGNCWTDMDMVCLRPITIAEEYCFSSEELPTGEPFTNVGFIKCPPKAEFLEDILKLIGIMGLDDVEWGTFGPKLFHFVMKDYDSIPFRKSPKVFCPVNTWDLRIITNACDYFPGEESLTVHLWHELWRLLKLDKNAAFPKESLFEKLKNRYQVF